MLFTLKKRYKPRKFSETRFREKPIRKRIKGIWTKFNKKNMVYSTNKFNRKKRIRDLFTRNSAGIKSPKKQKFYSTKKNKKEKTSKIGKTKKTENSIDSHVEAIKKIDKIMEKAEKKNIEKTKDSKKHSHGIVPSFFQKYLSNHQPSNDPEFLFTPPFQMKNISNINTTSTVEQNNDRSYENNNTLLISEPGEVPFEPSDPSLLNDNDSSTILIQKEKRDKQPKEKKDQRQSKQKSKWFYTGIKGFDELLKKGIPSESNIIVAGGPGCGKTIFCLQTIYNLALKGEDCVFLSMEEQPNRLMDHMKEFGFNVEEIESTEENIILKANGKGRISIKRLQPIRLARSIEALLEKASGTLPVDIDLVLNFIPENFDTKLLVLDSISAIETAFSGTKRQYRIYIEQLFRYFEERKLATFMITESSEAPQRFSKTGVEEFLADGIIVFYNFQGVKKRTRGTEIFKLRGAAHSQKIVPIEITNKGIVVTSDKSPRDKLIG